MTRALSLLEGTTLMAQSEEELKGLLMKVKEESENVGFGICFHLDLYILTTICGTEFSFIKQRVKF